MACTSWAEYCRLWSETGLFDDTKLFGTTYTHDCPVYYGIKGELFPIEISGNTATESVYIAKSNTLGEFFIGIPDINNTNNARSFQLMLKYCNPITALIDGCKCFTMSFQVKEQDSYFYTLDEVLSSLMNNQAEVYLLDAGSNGVNPSWQGKKEKQDLINKYSNLPSRWLKAYIFDYSLEDITNVSKPHSQIRGKSISLNDDKDTKPTDPLKAITPIMDAALARLAQSGDEAKINLAKAFKQVDKVESTLECGEDLFCLSETNPNDNVPIVFTGCVARIKGKVKFTFGPSIKDLIQVKLTFDKLMDSLSQKSQEGETYAFVSYSTLCQIYGWDDSNLSKCCSINQQIISPSTGSGSWGDKDMWSKYTFFKTHSKNPNNSSEEPGLGIIIRKSYAHFMLSSDPLLKRLVFSENLLRAIKECFDALSDTLISPGNDPTGGGGEISGCGNCNYYYTFDNCLGCLTNMEEQSDENDLLRKCSGSKTTTKCTDLLELKTLEQLIFTKRMTTTTLTASCPSGLSCVSEEGTTGGHHGFRISGAAGCAPYSGGSCGGNFCMCNGVPVGCCGGGWTVGEDESCGWCAGQTYVNNPNCQLTSTSQDSYEIIKKYYENKSSCLLQTVTSGTSATWSIPFLNLNFEKYIEACLSGNTPRPTITIPNAGGGTIPYDPANPDDPDNPNNGGKGDQPKPGGGNGSGKKYPKDEGGTDHPQPDPFHNCPKDQEDIDETKPTVPGLYYFGTQKVKIEDCVRSVLVNRIPTRLAKPVYKTTKKWVRCKSVGWKIPEDYLKQRDVGYASTNCQKDSLEEGDCSSPPVDMIGLICTDGYDAPVSNPYYVASDKNKPLILRGYLNSKALTWNSSTSWTAAETGNQSNVPSLTASLGSITSTTFSGELTAVCGPGISYTGAKARKICCPSGSEYCSCNFPSITASGNYIYKQG